MIVAVPIPDPVPPARTVQIRYSKDGGRNWSAWRNRDLGEVGDFMKRVKCLRLGQGLQWVFDIKTTAKADLLAASIQVEGER